MNEKLGHVMTITALAAFAGGMWATRTFNIGFSILFLAIGLVCGIMAIGFYFATPQEEVEWERDEYDQAVEKHNAKLQANRKAQIRRKKFKIIE